MTDLPDRDPWITAEDAALLVDQYELTMMQAFVEEGMAETATFSMYIRTLPSSWNYFLAAGLDSALRYLEQVSFTDDALDYLSSFNEFSPSFIDWLGNFQFSGDVRALPEGTPFFEDEPLLEVTAPIAEAQLAETFLMNQVHHQTLMASKASRVVHAAGSSSVVDFGLRRMHGTDAGLKAARSFHIAGCAATSNVLAGRVYDDIQVTGTMAHSYIQSHDSEMDAFRSFSDQYPETILLVDTYNTLHGVRKVIQLAEERGDDFQVRGIRLDSGDIGALAERARSMLDKAGLTNVDIFASGGMDEWKIAELLDEDAPIDGFGVGTRMGVSKDAPGVDCVYKLTKYAGSGRLKLSSGKKILPGPKQLYRAQKDGEAVRDVIGTPDEEQEGRPLLKSVMKQGERLPEAEDTLEDARKRAERELDRLPAHIRDIERADSPYQVNVSEPLRQKQKEVTDRVADQIH
jgi:nicotinate phosphoribosyltransferase